ncbi:MAG: hypothetical protein WCR58_03500 [Bacteroidales bacterium]|nr:hypothetical protein [Bacteroidales bacterium]MCK9448103.1 hypothetical protein [Bacteroidales bacterium]MDD3701241.1 hypothetical protein [Bacteroidales bacterium]MDY0368371.1 hypothetical protein [Bacteroidales bacterium]
MKYLYGDLQCKLDSKGRLMLPATFKEQLGHLVDEGFILRPGLFSACIELYTVSDWTRKQAHLGGLDQFDKVNIDLIRKYNAGVKFVKPDATGRLLVPRELMEYAGLSKDVVITALTSYMEIWDKVLYQQVLNEIDPNTMGIKLQEKLNASKKD